MAEVVAWVREDALPHLLLPTYCKLENWPWGHKTERTSPPH